MWPFKNSIVSELIRVFKKTDFVIDTMLDILKDIVFQQERLARTVNECRRDIRVLRKKIRDLEGGSGAENKD